MAEHHGPAATGDLDRRCRCRVPDALATDPAHDRRWRQPRLPQALSHVHFGSRFRGVRLFTGSPPVSRRVVAALRSRLPAARRGLRDRCQPVACGICRASARTGPPRRARRRTAANRTAALRRGSHACGRRCRARPPVFSVGRGSPDWASLDQLRHRRRQRCPRLACVHLYRPHRRLCDDGVYDGPDRQRRTDRAGADARGRSAADGKPLSRAIGARPRCGAGRHLADAPRRLCALRAKSVATPGNRHRLRPRESVGGWPRRDVAGKRTATACRRSERSERLDGLLRRVAAAPSRDAGVQSASLSFKAPISNEQGSWWSTFAADGSHRKRRSRPSDLPQCHLARILFYDWHAAPRGARLHIERPRRRAAGRHHQCFSGERALRERTANRALSPEG